MDTEMDVDAWFFCRAFIVLHVRLFPTVLGRKDLLLLSLERWAGFSEILRSKIHSNHCYLLPLSVEMQHLPRVQVPLFDPFDCTSITANHRKYL